MKFRTLPTILAFVAVGVAASAGSLSAQKRMNTPEAANPPAAVGSAAADLMPAQTSAISQAVEAFLRKTYAWGPAFELKVGPMTPAPAGNLYTVPVQVIFQGQTDSTTVYVSEDGRYMFRGDIADLNSDPFADVVKQLDPNGAASKGPADAKVVLVEFGDFECPSCRELDTVLRDILPKYPQVRLVFKDFPLEDIHPWARTAAIAGRCALHQSSDIFWKLHDSIYDNQDLISPENAYSKLTDLATDAGAKMEDFQACMSDPKTAAEVDESEEQGKSLEISSTPTTFVDGRRLIGPDQTLLEQYIQFDSTPTQK